MATPDFLPTSMSTLSEVMELLADRGFDYELTFSPEGKLVGNSKAYVPEDLLLIRTYRFEGISDPSDNAALYLFTDKEENIGFVIDIYGSESNFSASFADFLRNVPSI
jgi:hypothetical protein